MKCLEVFVTALKLGLTSFGGPVAHIGFFHDEYVKNKKWLSEDSYADLVALCQFLPGPASSQVGIAVGLLRAGIPGAFLSWLGFTLPSSILLILFALGIGQIGKVENLYWIHGLKVVAVSVVAHAILAMSKKLCPDNEKKVIAIFSCGIVMLGDSTQFQILAMVIAGLYGAIKFKGNDGLPRISHERSRNKLGVISIFIFFGLLFFLPLFRSMHSDQTLNLIDSFYRAGSLVFGGGHVVLPLLQAEVVPTGWITNDLFIAGYGVANAMPGPLFAFSGYLGAVSSVSPNGWTGGLLCLAAVFLPSFLLILGILPFWDKFRSYPIIRHSMLGLNASVVGLLIAAFFNPVWSNAIFSIKDFGLAIAGFILLEFLKLSSWKVVLISVGVSFFIY